AGLGGLAGVALLAAPARGLRTQHVDGSPVRLGEQERPQRPALGIELLGLVPEPEEHLLDDLLGHARVDQQPTGEREDRARVTPVRLGERVLPPAPDGDDDRGIARLPKGLSHHCCSLPVARADAARATAGERSVVAPGATRRSSDRWRFPCSPPVAGRCASSWSWSPSPSSRCRAARARTTATPGRSPCRSSPSTPTRSSPRSASPSGS